MSFSAIEGGVKRGTGEAGGSKTITSRPLISQAFSLAPDGVDTFAEPCPSISQYVGVFLSSPEPLPASPTSPRPSKGQRRAARQKQERQQARREAFPDAAGFAYFKGWGLNYRITITFPKCSRCNPTAPDFLGLDDDKLTKDLRHELRRVLRKAGSPFACIWSRSDGLKHGRHVHLALHWLLPLPALVEVLERMTGSQAKAGRLRGGVLAQSADDAWQVKRNTMSEIPSAMRWTNYMLGQEPVAGSTITGKLLGVSSNLKPKAIEAQRTAFEAWKLRVRWRTEWAH